MEIAEYHSKLRTLFLRLIWILLSFLMPKRRPLEVIYGRVKYCLTLFEKDISPENCARNWVMLFEVLNTNCILALSTLYGSDETIDYILRVQDLNIAGEALFDRREESMSDSERFNLASSCWSRMKTQILSFLDTEPDDVIDGSTKHCQSLVDRKYLYEDKGILSYPLFSL